MSRILQVGKVSLPCREVTAFNQTFIVPRGIARNRRNHSWQVKIIREGKTVLSGNFADSTLGSSQQALDAAIQFIVDSGTAEIPKTLKISDRAFLNWSTSRDALSMHASLYNPDLKHQTNMYLMIESKIATNTEALHKKICNVLTREWAENHPVHAVMDIVKMIKIKKDVTDLMQTKEWADFLRLGAEINAQSESA